MNPKIFYRTTFILIFYTLVSSMLLGGLATGGEDTSIKDLIINFLSYSVFVTGIIAGVCVIISFVLAMKTKDKNNIIVFGILLGIVIYVALGELLVS